MKINTALKLSQYLENIYELIFLMRNCLNIHRMEWNFMKKLAQQLPALIGIKDLPLLLCIHRGMGVP